MDRQLTRDEILNAKAVHLYNDNTVFVELDGCDDVYGSVDGINWYVKNNFWDYFESELMMSYFQMLTPEEALELFDKWNKERELNAKTDNCRLNKAIVFATEKHGEQLSKGTTLPYILHPLEALQILYSMRADTNLLIAGVLHDTVEDTDTSLEEIKEIFGDDVAMLVASNSEDKSKTWQERKQHTIDELPKSDLRVKKLIIADKLANIRRIAYDYKNIGDKLWERFNAPKEKQCWYYNGICDALEDLQNYPECAAAYWELTGLFKDVFVKYYYDDSDKSLYQVCMDGSSFVFQYEHPVWIPVEEKMANDIAENLFESNSPQYHNVKPNDYLTDDMLIPRKEAELTEDIWYREYWSKHSEDMNDNEWNIFSSERRSLSLTMNNRCLRLLGNDFGEECRAISGKDEYEFAYSLNEEGTDRLLIELRIKHGISISIDEIFKEEFGYDDGSVIFKDLCDKLQIETEFWNN